MPNPPNKREHPIVPDTELAKDRLSKLKDGEFEEIVSNRASTRLECGLYIISKRNPYFRPGTFVYLYDQGWQKVKLVKKKRAREVGSPSAGWLYTLKETPGIMLPESALAPFVRPLPRMF